MVLPSCFSLVIGPFFCFYLALQTTSFEIGLAPFIDPSRQTPLYLAIFQYCIFVLAWWFSRKPTKILDICWKVPESCIFGFIRCFASPCFLNPLGSVNQAPIQPNYQEHAFFTGFTQGI